MMKSVLLYSLVAASASAFAPSQSSTRSSTALNEFCRGYVGGDSVEPMFIGATGSKNFDPFGLTEVRTSGGLYESEDSAGCWLLVVVVIVLG